MILPLRYERPQLIFEGGMGRVYRAFDAERGTEVALKTLTNAHDEEARFLFRQEFWTMATLRHPALVQAFDFGELDGGTPYFTMEWVAGADLADALPVGEAAVRGFLPDVAAGLAYLHGQGLLHGDLSPRNVRLGEDGRARLMDLGLLAPAGRAAGAIRGSLPYVAPEAVRQATLDARSDLYALGGVLFHALAGRPPFPEEGLALLRAHLGTPAPALEGVTPAMANAVAKLLAKEPASRPASARALLAALDLPLDGLGGGANGLLASPLVGRDAELAEAQALLAVGPVVIAAGEGLGKSRLLAELRAAAQLAGRQTIALAGAGVEAPPYQAFRPWLKRIAGEIMQSEGELASRLAPALVRLMPSLDVPALPALEPTPERLRVHAALADWARATTPGALWLLDDADRLDPASSELLAFLRGQAGGWGWLLTSTGEIEGAQPLPLAPLPDADLATLAAHLLGQPNVPAAVAARLPVLAAGAPALVEALLQHWIRTGALTAGPDGWIEADGAAFDLPGGLTVVLDAKLQALSADAQRVARVAALLDPGAPPRLLADLADLPDAAFFQALQALDAAEVLVRDDAAGVRFARVGQREALAASLPADDAQALHARAAAWLEADLAEDPSFAALVAIARHRLAGPAPLTAVPWVLRAAAAGLVLHAPPPSEAQLRAVLALDGVTPADQARARQLLVDALRLHGRIDEALASLETEVVPPLRAAGDPQLRHALVALGVAQQLKGRYPEAMAALAEAINLADAADDLPEAIRARGVAGRVAYFAGEAGAARTTLAGAVRRARTAGLEHMLGPPLGLLGYLVATSGADRRAEGLALLEEANAHNRAIGDAYALFDSLVNVGNVHLASGRYRDAAPAFAESLALIEKLNFHVERAFGHLNLGAAWLELGDLAGARAQAREAVHWARKQGRKFPEGFALALQGSARLQQGEWAEGLEDTEGGLTIAQAIENKYLELAVLPYRLEALLATHDLAGLEAGLGAARRLAAESKSDEHAGHFDRLAAALRVRERHPAAGPALRNLVAATRAAGEAGGLAHALRWRAEHRLVHGDRAGALEDAAEAFPLAAAEGLLVLTAELRLLAGLASDERTTAEAHYRAGRAAAHEAGHLVLDVLCQGGVRTEAAEARQRLAAWRQALPSRLADAIAAWPGAAALLAPAAGGPSGEAGVDLAVVEAIATLGECADLDEAIAHGLAALGALTGFERACLVIYDGLEVVRQVFWGQGARADAFSSTLAFKVLWGGEPMYLEDAQAAEGAGLGASVQALELRAALGVPLREGEQVIGVLMADSRGLPPARDPLQVQLMLAQARQIAAHVGAALRLSTYANAHAERGFLDVLVDDLLATPDAGDRLRLACMQALALTGADRAVLVGPEPDGPPLFACNPRGEGLAGEEARVSRGAVDAVFQSGRALHVVDALGEENWGARGSVQALALRTVYAVPVGRGGETSQVLFLDSRRLLDHPATVLHTLDRLGSLLGSVLG